VSRLFNVFQGLTSTRPRTTANEFMLFKGEVEHHFGKYVLVRANAFFVRQDSAHDVSSVPRREE